MSYSNETNYTEMSTTNTSNPITKRDELDINRYNGKYYYCSGGGFGTEKNNPKSYIPGSSGNYNLTTEGTQVSISHLFKSDADRIGIILAAGKNSRAYPASYYIPKALFPIVDRPAIFFSIAQLIYCKVTHICIVTNKTNDEAIKRIAEYYTKGKVHITTAIQEEFNGPIDAMKIGYDKINSVVNITDKTNIYLYFADNIFIADTYYIARLINKRIISDNENVEADINFITYPTDHPEKFGIATTDDNGNVKIIEKPTNMSGIQKAVTGFYKYYNREYNFTTLLNLLSSSSNVKKYSITDFNNALIDFIGSCGSKRINVSHMSFSIGPEYDGNLSDIGANWYDIGTPDGYINCIRAFSSSIKSTGYDGTFILCPEIAGLYAGSYDINRDFASHIYDADYMKTDYVKSIIHRYYGYKELGKVIGNLNDDSSK